MPICPGPPARPATGITGGHVQLQVLYLVSGPAAPGNLAPLDADQPRAAGAVGDRDQRWPCPAAGAVPGGLTNTTRKASPRTMAGAGLFQTAAVVETIIASVLAQARQLEIVAVLAGNSIAGCP